MMFFKENKKKIEVTNKQTKSKTVIFTLHHDLCSTFVEGQKV